MTRPMPRREGVAAPFWDAAERKELIYQLCTRCGTVQTYPRHRCGKCLSGDLQWRTSEGRGRIMTFTVVHRSPSPAFRTMVPYTLGLIEMEEGFRLMIPILTDSRDRVRVGGIVRVTFAVHEGMSLPEARPA